MPAEHMLKGTAEVKFRQLERAAYLTFDLDNRLRIDKVMLDGAEARFRQYDLDGTVEVSTATASFRMSPRCVSNTKASLIRLRETSDGDFVQHFREWRFPALRIEMVPYQRPLQRQGVTTLTVHVPSDWTAVSDLPAEGGKFSSAVPSYWGCGRSGKIHIDHCQNRPRGSQYSHAEGKGRGCESYRSKRRQGSRFLRELFGPPVQPKFHIIEAADANWPSRWGVGTLLMSNGQFRPDFDQPALAIALAHQWFPLKFAIADPARDAWLSDGFATFASLLFAEKNLSPAAYQEQVDKALVKALASENAISVLEAGKLDRESPDYRALVQYKGAYIFRMLQWVIGDEKFQRFS